MLRRALPFLAVLLVSFPAFAEMTVDDLIAKNIEARGGQEAWEAIKTAKIVGNMNFGGGMEAPMTIYFKRPDKMRMEMEMQGMKIVQAFDGTTGWQIMPMMGKTDAQEMSDDELKMTRKQADAFEGPLFNHEEKGYQVELMGTEEIEGTEAYKLKVISDDGDVTYTWLDTEYFLEFRQESEVTTPTGQTLKSISTLGDYKEVGDLIVHHSVEIKPEGMPQGMAISFESIELNSDLGDEFFVMPAPKPAEAAAAEGSE